MRKLFICLLIIYVSGEIVRGGMSESFSPLFTVDTGGSEVNRNGASVLPQQIRLQCYPNPFNETAIIKFFAETGGRTIVEVFNVEGEKTADIYCGFTEIGWKELSFSADNLSSGIYLIRVITGNNSQIRKIVILR